MQRLRHARSIARLVLAWFALSIGLAVAAPLVHPQAMELVCSGSGAMKLLVKSADGSSQSVSPTLDCPLCASIDAPPVAAPRSAVPLLLPLAHAVQPIPAAHIAARVAAPLPARGPPHSLQI